jgi:hypothetical protein
MANNSIYAPLKAMTKQAQALVRCNVTKCKRPFLEGEGAIFDGAGYVCMKCVEAGLL